MGFWDYDSLECGNCKPEEGIAEVLKCRARCWSPWGNWSPCSRDCGAHGVMTRVRSVITTECACPGNGTETSHCNVFCLNGGQPIPGNLTHSCYCLSGYSGQCCEISENETISSSGNHGTQNMDAKNLKGSVSRQDDSSNLSMPLIIGFSIYDSRCVHLSCALVFEVGIYFKRSLSYHIISFFTYKGIGK